MSINPFVGANHIHYTYYIHTVCVIAFSIFPVLEAAGVLE